MKLSGSLHVVIVLLSLAIWSVNSQAQFDCGESLNSRVPRISYLTVFPNPARVGQIVHVRAVVKLPDGISPGSIKDGSMSMELKFKDDVFASIPGIPLCDASSSIVCNTLASGDNAISFDYRVPVIPAGKYTTTLRIYPNRTATALEPGCLWFDIDIQDPDADKGKFTSWIAGELAGVSQFEHDNYMQRTLGEIVQIGPIGGISPILAYTFPWGTFISLTGSGDLVQPYFDPTGYVWGLNGHMEEMTYQGVSREHVYRGDYYIGYVSSLQKRTLDVEILTGTFTLTWAIKPGADGVVSSNLTGTISFDNDAELPFGFSNPVTVGRLGTLAVTTSAEGILLLNGAENTCLNDPNCNVNQVQQKDNGDDDVPGWLIGAIIGGIVGLVLVILIVAFIWRRHRRSKRHEEEDGIFSATRKPEYGNALVVDDIIQETREHSPKMMPPLSRDRQQDFSDSESSYTRSSRSRSRSRSRSPSLSYDRTPSASRSRSRSASRSYSDSESDYTDAGSSASRA